MVLACDGLFDVMTHQEVADYTHQLFSEGHDASSVAKSMVLKAINDLSTDDNVTVIIVKIDWENESGNEPVNEPEKEQVKEQAKEQTNEPVNEQTTAPHSLTPTESTTSSTPVEHSTTHTEQQNQQNQQREPRTPSKTTLFVSNLPFSFRNDDLAQVFQGLNVKNAYVALTRGGRSRGYGFVEFENEADQQTALTQKNNFEVEGANDNKRNISVVVAHQVFEKDEGSNQQQDN